LKTHLALVATLVTVMVAGHGDAGSRTIPSHALARSVAPATFTVYRVRQPRGLMVTTGGWAYCEQVRALARRTGYTLLCSRYAKDGYLGYGLRSERHLDWGDPRYLGSLAAKIQAVHQRVGGELVLIGVSYSGFGIATLASHHPEIHPDRLIVIDSFLNLVARRAALPPKHETAREIDSETGGSVGELQARSVTVEDLARLVEAGTRLTVVWSVSPDEDKEFNGATCNRHADAGVLLSLADVLKQPVIGWVTRERHGHALRDHGAAILGGHVPGRQVVFRPRGSIPQGAVCP
jgi:pimeloyl-ACP methyl ester carboxylesterase